MQLALEFKEQLDIPFDFFVLYESGETTCQRMPKGTNYFRGKTSLLCVAQRNTLHFNTLHRNAKIDKGDKHSYYLAVDFKREEIEALQEFRKQYVWYEVHSAEKGLGIAFVKRQDIYKLYNSKRYTSAINKKVENYLFLWQELQNNPNTLYELHDDLYIFGDKTELDWLVRGILCTK
jgi:hypothetical protein